MAGMRRVSESDLAERASLERTLADVERHFLDFPLGLRPFFTRFTSNARARLDELDRKIQEAEREQREHERNEVAAVVALAERETALSAQERETFSGFLTKNFFTRNDFANLEKFYASAWERLSERGRDEMSHRVWEGVRKGEYTFGELPKTVREKEAKQAYKRLRDSSNGLELEGIPASDREEFIRAYEAGKREEAERVLERDSFKKNLFRSSESTARLHVSATLGGNGDRAAVAADFGADRRSANAERVPEGAERADKDLSAFALDGIKLVEASSQGTSADLPMAGGAPPVRRR